MPRVDRTPIPDPVEYFEGVPLYYSIQEIICQFKEAKYKKHQLGVLANMNLCTKKDIYKLLLAYGLIKQKKKKAA